MTDDNRCSATAPERGAWCTLPTGHRLPHRGEGCMWLEPENTPACPALRMPQGAQCTLPVGHRLPHRDGFAMEWPLPFDGKDEPRRCAAFSHGADGGRCIFDAGHEHPHRDERDTEWQKQRWHYDDTAASKGLLGRLRDLNDSLDKVCKLVSRAQDVCGATHTPDDVTYVCSRRSGHGGAHLDDAQDEWWMPVGGAQPGSEKPVAGLDVCGRKAGGDYDITCTESNGHDMPHKDKLTGLTWDPEPTAECGHRTTLGGYRFRCSRFAGHNEHHADRRFNVSWTENEGLPSLCTWPCALPMDHDGECESRT